MAGQTWAGLAKVGYKNCKMESDLKSEGYHSKAMKRLVQLEAAMRGRYRRDGLDSANGWSRYHQRVDGTYPTY